MIGVLVVTRVWVSVEVVMGVGVRVEIVVVGVVWVVEVGGEPL